MQDAQNDDVSFGYPIDKHVWEALSEQFARTGNAAFTPCKGIVDQQVRWGLDDGIDTLGDCVTASLVGQIAIDCVSVLRAVAVQRPFIAGPTRAF